MEKLPVLGLDLTAPTALPHFNNFEFSAKTWQEKKKTVAGIISNNDSKKTRLLLLELI